MSTPCFVLKDLEHRVHLYEIFVFDELAVFNSCTVCFDSDDSGESNCAVTGQSDNKSSELPDVSDSVIGW